MPFLLSPGICISDPCFGCRNCIDWKIKQQMEIIQTALDDIKFSVDSMHRKESRK